MDKRLVKLDTAKRAEISISTAKKHTRLVSNIAHNTIVTKRKLNTHINLYPAIQTFAKSKLWSVYFLQFTHCSSINCINSNPI